MGIQRIGSIQGKRVELLEMTLSNVDNQLVFSWKIRPCNVISRIIFYNVSRLRIERMSPPLEIMGFEIIDHSKDGWGTESKYEIRDFEDNRISFFCEHFMAYSTGDV